MSLTVAGGAGLLFSLAVTLQVGWEEGLLCLLATAGLMAAALPLLLQGRNRLVEPVSFVVLITAIGLTGKAFYICLGPAERVGFLLLGKEPRELLFAALVMTAGLLTLSLGYLMGNVRWRVPGLGRLTRGVWDVRKTTAVAGMLVIVGLFSFVLFTMQLDFNFRGLSDLSSKRFVAVEGSNLPGSLGYLRWGATLIEIGFYLAFAHWAASRKRLLSFSGGVVVALALTASIYPIFTSSRMTIMMMIVRMVLVWMCLRGEPRPRSVLALVALGFMIIGPMLAFRRGLADWEGVGGHLGVARLLEETVGSRHFLDLTKTAHVLAAVPGEMDYQYGRTLLTWLVAPVPRAVWPDKPAVNVGQELGPALFETNARTGVPPGMVGELYLNFGLLGVLVGLLAVGLLLRSLYATLEPHLATPGVALVYALLVTRLAFGMLANSASGDITRLLKELVPVLPALLLIGRREEQASETAPAGPTDGRSAANQVAG